MPPMPPLSAGPLPRGPRTSSASTAVPPCEGERRTRLRAWYTFGGTAPSATAGRPRVASRAAHGRLREDWILSLFFNRHRRRFGNPDPVFDAGGGTFGGCLRPLRRRICRRPFVSQGAGARGVRPHAVPRGGAPRLLLPRAAEP